MALLPHRFKALRCGRRFGKTEFAQIWIRDGLVRGQECAWFAPHHMTWAEVYPQLSSPIRHLVGRSSKSSNVLRLKNGGRVDFWTLEKSISGRGRGYHRVVIDEAAFAKNGDNKTDGSMMEIWEKSIKPTLLDVEGEALICSNTAGKNPDNFFYNICTDSKYGFAEYHATTADNPVLPKRLDGETTEKWLRRREEMIAGLKRDNDPLVFAQEYLAEFVDWAGVAFFSRDKLLEDGRPSSTPTVCDTVFAVIDTASKTGTDNDATAATFFAYDRTNNCLWILDWDVVQIEGALLETWLPTVFQHLETLASQCHARFGSSGAWIEDMNSGTILLQQARRRGWRAQAIDSKLTSLGKDERAISVSGYVHRGWVKITGYAFDKVTAYKQKSRNHFLEQVEGFRIGNKKDDREDDLLDTFCYGIAVALGNNEGF